MNTQMSKPDIVDTFLELHEEEHTATPSPDTCPACDVLTKETQQLFEDHLMTTVLEIVRTRMEVWDKRAYNIAVDTTPEILASAIVGKILDYPIMPKMINIRLESHEIWTHPYIEQKIRELNR